ncbi:MAG: 4-hydroxy-tetrahydrodipicolinate reductase [Ignavibacterium sp.]
MGKIKYGIIGASGRMGNEIISIMNENNNELVFRYDLEGEWMKEKPQLLIDFSLPEVFEISINYALNFKVPLIIGTTGLNENQFKKLKEISKNIPITQSYNFSIGIQMLLKCAELLSAYLSDWDIEISETHHRFKLDKPSGTALMLKNLIKEKTNREINISSLRLGNVAGEHSVFFGSLGEVIEIKHSATSRRTFAEGVLKSANFIMNKKNGFYSFQDVLFYKK